MATVDNLANTIQHAVNRGLAAFILEENEWKDFTVNRDCYSRGIIAFANDGWKEAKITGDFDNLPEIINALKADLKRQWREGAFRGVAL